MLNVPSILFVNCIGSYYYSIMEHLNGDAKYNELLLYLSDGKPIYKSADMQKIYEKHKNDPWGYQPIAILSSNNQEIKVDENFYGFLEQKLKLKVLKEDISRDKSLKKRLIFNLENRIFSIVNVDEYYIPTSKKNFEKRHNKHSLLVKSINTENEQITMIDSEENKAIEISLESLEKSILMSEFSHNYLFMVDTGNYQNDADVTWNSKTVITNIFDWEFIDYMIADISKKQISENAQYFFQGYFYNILSKIIPYLSMAYFVTVKDELDLSETVMDILKEWRALCNFMQIKIIKKTYDFEFLKNKLMHIKSKYVAMKDYGVKRGYI